MCIKYLFYLFLIFAFTYCKGQDVTSVNLKVKNNSSTTRDSLQLNFLGEKRTYYNLKSKDSLQLTFKIESKNVPRGESSVFDIVIFKGDFFYWSSTGFIGMPTAYIESDYGFYIYDDYVTIEDGYVPLYKEALKPISEFRK